MRGFYSPIDKLAADIPRTKGTGAEFMTELSKRPGYKTAEAEDRNLQTLMALPKMERAQFLQALKAKPAPSLEESKRVETPQDPDDARTKYDGYTLPGGENYREILLNMPHDPNRTESPSSSHWGSPDVLAHVRAKDRAGPNGEKILHLEEIQSDWHQAGREKGYQSPDAKAVRIKAQNAYAQARDALANHKREMAVTHAYLASDAPIWQQPEAKERLKARRTEQNKVLMDLLPKAMRADTEYQKALKAEHDTVPDAPFKKNWHELALKKMIHHAATNGYDSIAITPGAEQAKRYGLSKHVSRITHMTHNDDPDSGILFAFDPTGRQIVEKHNVPHSELPSYIGKEGAQKLLGQKPDEHGYRELSGQNLEVGGEGMKGFYDKMIPSFLNQFGKKYGAKVGTTGVGGSSNPTDEEARVHHGIGILHWRIKSPEEKEQLRQQAVSAPVNLHTFPITPEMREDVTKNGVPLYAEGGSVTGTEGGNDTEPSLEAIQNVARKGNGYQNLERYLQLRDAMPSVKMGGFLPDYVNGQYLADRTNIGSGDITLNKNTSVPILPSVLTHEMAHAADRQLNQQAIEQGMFGKSNQFTEAYEKMVGSSGKNRTKLARDLNPDWAKATRLYRANPYEIAGHGMGAFSGPNSQDPAPAHVDATAATDLQILTDLAQRHINEGPKGLHKIPAFIKKFAFYAEGGKVDVRPTVKDDTLQRKIPEIEEAAKALQTGIINRKDYDKVVNKHKPVKPYTFVPQPASDEDAERALMANKKPHWRGHQHWPAGRKVGLRLDIPAYETHGVWVNSIHDEEGKGEDKQKTSYGPVSSVKNATFDAGPAKGIKVATGEDNKSPFARIHGELHHMTEEEAVEHMKTNLNHPDYAQVGMDPRRHGFFYDRKSMKPVTHSAHVVQIGPLVLAHKPTYGKRETYAKGGDVSRETIKPVGHGYTREQVTVAPNLDAMKYELMSVKHFAKKAK